MKRPLEELLDSLGPKELDALLPEEIHAPISDRALKRMEARAFKKAGLKPGPPRRFRLRARWVAAACLALTVGLTGAAFAAEAKEYSAAVEFFNENGLSTEGLSRTDVKEIYRDITTQRFTYGKTAEVIERSVPGVEIFQKEPTPEELAELWNRDVWRTAAPMNGVYYSADYLERLDETLGFDVFDHSVLKCYRDGEFLWAAVFSAFYAERGVLTSAGTAAWGYTPTWSSEQPSFAWLARVDGGGAILWQRRLDHGFQNEDIAAVLDNGDGTWAVISRGDLRYLCLSQYDLDGNELSFHRTEVGNRGIWNAARLGDGYLVHLGHGLEKKTAWLVKLDREGNLTDDFVYEGTDCDYCITGMAEFGGRMYLSAYAVPKQSGAGNRFEISDILDDLLSRGRVEISSEELTPMVRNNYTAVLLVCDPEGGAPETFYSVKGSLGGGLNVDGEQLRWDVESVASAFFSPATSSFTIGANCQVFRYTFDSAGTLVSQEDTGETVGYYR